LFQLLRDDFITLFVRGCWLVSFFFTPIYMFILAFIVMFGPKKGTIAAYSGAWDFDSRFNTSSLTYNSTSPTTVVDTTTRYQFTVITSRLTSYLLLSFWVFFFFFGETLLLLVFNYTSLVDTITSSSFFTLKQHIIFFLTTTPVQLSQHINIYIYFLTACAVSFLLNFNYSYNYNYMRNSSLNSVFPVLVLVFYVLV
jgi:hypothetical protein